MTTKKRQMMILSDTTRIRPSRTVLIVLICLVCLVSSAYGSSTTTREIVLDNLATMHLTQADKLLKEEFKSVENVLKKADMLSESGQKEESQKYYRFAYVKAEMLEKHFEEEKGVCWTNGPFITTREIVLDNLATMRLTQVDKLLKDEFKSVEDVLKKADKLKECGEKEESEKYYRFAYVKAEMLEKHFEEEKVKINARKMLDLSYVTNLGKVELKKKPSMPIKDETNGTRKDNKKQPAEWDTAEMLIGSDIIYVVRKLETLKMVSAKTGVSWQLIAKDNSLNPKKSLQPGKILRINTRRIVPKSLTDGIVINIPDLTLYLFKEGRLHATYPVALGMTKKSTLCSWHTPTGKFKITSKSKNPTWNVPPSLQQKMIMEGKAVVTVVPPGPRNPLGKFALRTSLGDILIHSTISPESINSFSSHGCVRMLPLNMEAFFNTIKVNTRGEIIYQPVKVAVSDKGRVFLEVDADAYNMVSNLESSTKKLLEEKKAVDRVNWKKVQMLLKNGNGEVEDISL